MLASPPAACACWPKTVRRTGSGLPTRSSPRRWSRVPKPLTCWRWPGCKRPPCAMSTSTRWTVVVLAVIVALGVGFWVQLDRPQAPGRPGQVAAREHRDADTAEALAGPRARADLPPCPPDGPGSGSPKLQDITVECAANGSAVDVAKALAG